MNSKRKPIIFAIFISTFLISCFDETDNYKQEKLINKNTNRQKEIKKVTGLGGVFFKCEDAEKMKEWFHKNLDLVVNEYGSIFEFRLTDNPNEFGYLQWSPFSNKTSYFDPSEKELMINYRVHDLEGILVDLKENDVTILDTIESYEYGKFLHILDPENNKIELWEPIDSVFTGLYSGLTTVESGIGGVFFKSKDPEMIKTWYEKNLGIVMDQYGCKFEFIDPLDSNAKQLLQWSPFPDSTDYFEPSDKQFMINYRVKDIEGLVNRLIKNGVTIVDSIIDYGEYGKFVHVLAPENTKIELWEQPEKLK